MGPPLIVMCQAWPDSPGLGLALEGLGLVKPQARPLPEFADYHFHFNVIYTSGKLDFAIIATSSN